MSFTVQIIVPADKILNVSGFVEKSDVAASWYTVTLPVAVKPLYDAVNVKVPALCTSPIFVLGISCEPVIVASEVTSTVVPSE